MNITQITNAFDTLGIDDEGYLLEFDGERILAIAQYEDIEVLTKRLIIDPAYYADVDHAAHLDWLHTWINTPGRQSLREMVFGRQSAVTHEELRLRTIISVGDQPITRSIRIGLPVTTGFSFICQNGWPTKTRSLANTFGIVTAIESYDRTPV